MRHARKSDYYIDQAPASRGGAGLILAWILIFAALLAFTCWRDSHLNPSLTRYELSLGMEVGR